MLVEPVREWKTNSPLGAGTASRVFSNPCLDSQSAHPSVALYTPGKRHRTSSREANQPEGGVARPVKEGLACRWRPRSISSKHAVAEAVATFQLTSFSFRSLPRVPSAMSAIPLMTRPRRLLSSLSKVAMNAPPSISNPRTEGSIHAIESLRKRSLTFRSEDQMSPRTTRGPEFQARRTTGYGLAMMSASLQAKAPLR